jgi:prevent-host-death family protein
MEHLMTTVGSYEAKTHLPQLLERVARGEEILITRHGKAMARLVPANDVKKSDLKNVIQRMRDLRKGVTLGPNLTIRQLIEEDRRF